MKKTIMILIAISIILVSSACQEQPAYTYKEGVYVYRQDDGYRFSEPTYVSEVDLVPDADTAITIATVYLFQRLKSNPDSRAKLVADSVLFDTESYIWIVHFSRPNTLGGDYDVAVSRNTGEVLGLRTFE